MGRANSLPLFFLSAIRSKPGSLSRDGHDVGTGAERGRFLLDLAYRGEQTFALCGIVPQSLKVVCQPAWTFNGHQFYILKAGSQELVRQFLRPMKEGIGEIDWISGGIAVLSFLQVPREDGRESRVVEETVCE